MSTPPLRYTLHTRADPDVVMSFYIVCNQPPVTNDKSTHTYENARNILIRALDSANAMDRYVYGLARVCAYGNLGDREGGFDVLAAITGREFETNFTQFFRSAIPSPCRSFVDITPQTLAAVAMAAAALAGPTPRMSARDARFYLQQFAVAGVPHAIVARATLMYDDETRADYSANKEFAAAAAIGYAPAVVLDWRSHVYPSRVCRAVPSVHDLWNAIDNTHNQGDVIFPFNSGSMNSVLEVAAYAYMGTSISAAVAVYRRLADIGCVRALRWYARAELIRMCFPEPAETSGPMALVWVKLIHHASRWKRGRLNLAVAERIFSYINTYVTVTGTIDPVYVLCLRYGIGAHTDRASARTFAHNNCLDPVYGLCYAIWSREDGQRAVTLTRGPNLSPILQRQVDVIPGSSLYYDPVDRNGLIRYCDPFECIKTDAFNALPDVVAHDTIGVDATHDLCVICLHRKRAVYIAPDGYFAPPPTPVVPPSYPATLRSHYLNWQNPPLPPT